MRYKKSYTLQNAFVISNLVRRNLTLQDKICGNLVQMFIQVVVQYNLGHYALELVLIRKNLEVLVLSMYTKKD